MKCKKLLRFYFSAESVNRTLNNLITAAGCSSGNAAEDGLYYAEKLLGLIEVKRELSLLWRYLDGVMDGLKESERQILKRYGALRCGIAKLDEAERRGIRRAAVKFMRHCRGLGRFAAAVGFVGEYYELMRY